MAREFDSAAAEAAYLKEHGKEEYKGAQDYARKMSIKELDEYAARKREDMKGSVNGALLKMGQESLEYERQYTELLNNKKRKVTPFVKPKAIAPAAEV